MTVRDDTPLIVPDVSHETRQRLDGYAAELLRWNRRINLIGPSTESDIAERHIADSLQLLPLLHTATRIVDLGSGAGLPGMVLAIALSERTGTTVTLIESNAKKCAFLRHVAHILDAPATIVNARIEDALHAIDRPDVVTARALAPLSDLLKWCAPWIAHGTRGVFLKGAAVDKEITAVDAGAVFAYTRHRSATEVGGVVLEVSAAPTP